MAIRDNLVKLKPLRWSLEAVCMHAALNCSIEACLIKRHTRCLLNSHDGICGEPVFEMEMAGCWLLGYQSKVGYNWEAVRQTFTHLANCPVCHLWLFLMPLLQYLCKLKRIMMDWIGLCGFVCLNRRFSVKILATVTKLEYL